MDLQVGLYSGQKAKKPSLSNTVPNRCSKSGQTSGWQSALSTMAGVLIECKQQSAILRWDPTVQQLRAEITGSIVISLEKFEQISGSTAKNIRRSIRIRSTGMTLAAAAAAAAQNPLGTNLDAEEADLATLPLAPHSEQTEVAPDAPNSSMNAQAALNAPQAAILVVEDQRQETDPAENKRICFSACERCAKKEQLLRRARVYWEGDDKWYVR